MRSRKIEANWLAWTLLLPRDALIAARRPRDACGSDRDRIWRYRNTGEFPTEDDWRECPAEAQKGLAHSALGSVTALSQRDILENPSVPKLGLLK